LRDFRMPLFLCFLTREVTGDSSIQCNIVAAPAFALLFLVLVAFFW
jgi:hypothetical protein